MGDYLDKTGLTRLWSKIKTYVSNAYTSKAASSGGTAVSLVTTGEKYTWNNKTSNTGTVTSVATGAGLTGGTITGSGTIKADLKSETRSSLTAASKGSTSNREYAVGLDANGDLSVNVPWGTGLPDAGAGWNKFPIIDMTMSFSSYSSGKYSSDFGDIVSATLDTRINPQSSYYYEVIIDNQSYNCNALDYTENDRGIVLGNPNLISSSYSVHNFPFCIYRSSGYNYSIITTLSGSSHYIRINAYGWSVLRHDGDNDWVATAYPVCGDYGEIDPLALPCPSIREGNSPGSVEEGSRSNVAYSPYTHAEGMRTHAQANCAHAEGYLSYAGGLCSHAEGGYGNATGNSSHVEGSDCDAYGIAAHAEGVYSIANGDTSHAEGYATIANAPYSHTQGYNTISSNRSQHVFGEYNLEDPASASSAYRGYFVEIVGNGTDTDHRSNARTLTWNGDEFLAGRLHVGELTPIYNDEATTKSYVDYLPYSSASITLGTNVTGSGTLYRIGRLVILNATLKYTGTAASSVTLGSIKSAQSSWKPVADMWLSCDCYRTGYGITTYEAKITSSGNIVAGVSTNNQELKIHGIWIAAQQ